MANNLKTSESYKGELLSANDVSFHLRGEIGRSKETLFVEYTIVGHGAFMEYFTISKCFPRCNMQVSCYKLL